MVQLTRKHITLVVVRPLYYASACIEPKIQPRLPRKDYPNFNHYMSMYEL